MLSLLIIAGFMVFVTFFGKQFSEQVSAILSPQIRPAFVPTVGLEWTEGTWEWWTGARAWLESLGIAPLITVPEVEEKVADLPPLVIPRIFDPLRGFGGLIPAPNVWD